MMEDVMPLSPENFSIGACDQVGTTAAATTKPLFQILGEGISSPGPIPLEFCDDTDFFLDNLDSDLPSFPPDAATSFAPASTSATVTIDSGGSEGHCRYVDDNDSYTFDPATISALFDSHQPYDTNQLDSIQPVATAYQLPVAPIYDQEQFQQSLCADTTTSGCYSPFAHDSLALQILAGSPGQQLAPEYGESLAAPAPMPGYAGLDPMPPCPFLDAASTNGNYQDTMGMGLFSRAMMLGLEPEMVTDGGVGPMPEAIPRIYSSGDMQMMGDCPNLVGMCNGSNAKPLPTSEIPELDNVCRLTAGQRKEKIRRYLKKKKERNFSKKIKYACRKTLADNRPRVRGRFAKNDELGEATNRAGSSNHEYDDYEVGMKEDHDVLPPDTSTYRWCDLLEIQLQS